MDFMAVYGEAGMIGVVGVMFVYLVISLSKKSEAQQQALENLKVENKGQSETLENMEGMRFFIKDKRKTLMDSLKVTGLSTSLGVVYWTDILSGILMCAMFAVQIYYLYLKTKKIKES